MNSRLAACLASLLTVLVAAATEAQEVAVRPYVDPGQLDVPWPKHVYVMTYDATQPMAEEPYRLLIRGFSGARGRLALYDPHEDRHISVKPSDQAEDFVEVVVPITAYPRLLTLTE